MIVGVALALLAWIWLIGFHGKFWQSGPRLDRAGTRAETPEVAIIVPARDEAAQIAATLRSLLAQDYSGTYQVLLVDDGSTDGTGQIARGIADPRLRVITGQARPPGWSGKLWAVAQGIAAAPPSTALLLLTDADILHAPGHLSALVAAAEARGLDLVSEMVALNCASLAERALVPAFVYFFQLLYPFAWVNDPRKPAAAAAGGTMLVRRTALERIGGIGAIKGALIDDVALARAIKPGGPIWLGHARDAKSIRPYPDATSIWRMIARTAYVQLGYAPLLLLGTVLGLCVIFVVPPAATLFGSGPARLVGAAAWILMASSIMPTLRRFGLSVMWAAALPLVAIFYLAATIGSAVDHYAGRGVRWKGRAYEAGGPA